MNDGNVRKICICGGGNQGHALAGMLGSRSDLEINMLTRRPELWKHEITVINPEGLKSSGNINIISDNPKHVIPQSDLIIISLPSYAVLEVLERISPYVPEKAWVGAFPGTGGFDWMAKKILHGKNFLFGLQRVPYISRIIKYGDKVNVSGIKSELKVAALPFQYVDRIASILHDIFEVPIKPLNNYLAITLTPSNPILHPSRLYLLFRDWQEGLYFDKNPLFYEDWDIQSSQILLECDSEVQNLCSLIPLDLTEVLSLKKHYGVNNHSELTTKISGIKAFKGITSPMIKTEKGYIPDFNSRYFTEDIPYGLVIIRAIAELFSFPTPTIDKIIEWAQFHMNKQYLVDGKLIGADICNTGVPQIFNIDSTEKIINAACC